MDAFMYQEIQKNASRIQGLMSRIQQASRIRPGATESQVLFAMLTLVRVAQEAKPTGPLSSVVRNDASIRSAAAQVHSTGEQRLAFLADLLVTPEAMRKGLDATRGYFPRIAHDLQRAMLKKRAESKSDDPN